MDQLQGPQEKERLVSPPLANEYGQITGYIRMDSQHHYIKLCEQAKQASGEAQDKSQATGAVAAIMATEKKRASLLAL